MNVFDIIGPVMIGPSSSHTAGAARIGRIARALLGERPVAAGIQLHGSFARTYRGHGTDKALVAGILDLLPDDARLRDSLALAAQQGLAVSISTVELEDAHPNTAVLTLTGEQGGQVTVRGASVGGGNVRITQVDGMAVEFTGQYATTIVLHRDVPGLIAAVSKVMSDAGVNICNFRLARNQKGGLAVMTIETDNAPGPHLPEKIAALPHVERVTMLPAI